MDVDKTATAETAVDKASSANKDWKRKIEVRCLPPFRDETAEGWGTRTRTIAAVYGWAAPQDSVLYETPSNPSTDCGNIKEMDPRSY